MGGCPVYSLTVHGNGNVEYEGVRYVPVRGRRTSTISIGKLQSLLGAIDRALEAFQDKEGWTQLMRNGMARHYGWDGPAKEYAEVYVEVVRRRS